MKKRFPTCKILGLSLITAGSEFKRNHIKGATGSSLRTPEQVI
jgi:hypothetical protein